MGECHPDAWISAKGPSRVLRHPMGWQCVYLMMSSEANPKPQRVLVFQQNGSGEYKIRGIRRFGGDRFVVETYDIDVPLPDLIEHGDGYLPGRMDADLVLDYLEHPDLSNDLWLFCRKCEIPVVASGKKSSGGCAITPRTCCALPRRVELGAYGELFGVPEFQVTVEAGMIAGISVLHGAPCGATWDAAEKTVGVQAEDAAVHMALSVQYFCKANPAGWDVMHGKSPVHFAAALHKAALENALDHSRSRR
jgi:thymidylate synthase